MPTIDIKANSCKSGILRFYFICFFLSQVFLLHPLSVFADNPGYHLYVTRFFEGDMVILESATHKEIGKINFGFGSNPVEVLPSHDYKYLYVIARGADEVVVIDVKSKVIKARIKTGIHPETMKITPDRRYMVVANNQDEYASVIDLSTNTEIAKPRVSDENSGASDVDITPDGRFAYITAIYTSEIAVIDLKSMERVSVIKGFPAPSAIAISPDGLLACVVNIAGNNRFRVSILETGTHKAVGHIAVGQQPNYITLSPKGRLAFVSNYFSQTVSVIDIAKRSLIKDIKVGQEPGDSALSPDGRFLFVADYGGGIDTGTLSVIDVEKLEKVDRIKFPRYPRAIAVLPAE